MKVTRADWAAAVPWDGVQNPPPFASPEQISSLQAEITALQEALAALALRVKKLEDESGGGGDGGNASLTTIQIGWEPGEVWPLQFAFQDFTVSGPVAAGPCDVVPPYDLTNARVRAWAFSGNRVRLFIENWDVVNQTFAAGTWTIRAVVPAS